MIGWERRVLLRHYLEQGLTKTELAERFGISRQTIHRWVRAGELDRDLGTETVMYGPRPRVPTKLDRYKGIIGSRLAEYPDLTAVRLFAEVKAAGYEGGYTQVKAYVRKVRPRPPAEPVVRFETAPGHQGQVDFAEFRLPWGKRFALLVVLGYSRQLWLRFFPRQTMAHVFEGLEAALASFDGVPSELLFDQMKAVITDDASRRTRSSCASPITGASGSERVGPIEPRPRGRWSDRSAMCAQASSTAGRSRPTRI